MIVPVFEPSVDCHLFGHVPDLERVQAVDYTCVVIIHRIAVVILAARSVPGRKIPAGRSLVASL